MSRLLQALRSRVAVVSTSGAASKDSGMSTAEYCVGLVAACAFAALLYKLLTGSLVQNLVKGLIVHALSFIHF